jgi:hypothetical protein
MNKIEQEFFFRSTKPYALIGPMSRSHHRAWVPLIWISTRTSVLLGSEKKYKHSGQGFWSPDSMDFWQELTGKSLFPAGILRKMVRGCRIHNFVHLSTFNVINTSTTSSFIHCRIFFTILKPTADFNITWIIFIIHVVYFPSNKIILRI